MYEHRPKSYRDTPSHNKPGSVPSRAQEIEQRQQKIREARERNKAIAGGALGVRHRV